MAEYKETSDRQSDQVVDHPTHVVPPGIYLTVLIALMLLLVLTVIMAFVDIDRFTHAHHLGSGWNTGIALTIAFIKGLLILLFFMHVKYATKLTWAVASAGFVWLGIMLVLTMSDYMTRNHPPGVSAKGEPKYILPETTVPAKATPQLPQFPGEGPGYH